MDLLLKQKVDLMVENYYEIRDSFAFEYSIVKHFIAMNLASKNKSVNIDEIKEIKSYIKKEVGLFSNFRGTNLLTLSSLLYLEYDYKTYFKNMQNVYKKMNDVGFRKTQYLPLAAYSLVKYCSMYMWDEKISRMKSFYCKMKKNHFWLTSSDDYVLAAVLATSDLDIEKSTEEMEKCYKFLNKKGFSKSDGLQTLSQILTFGEEDSEIKCNKALSLFTKLKNEKCKLRYDGLGSLGVLTLISLDENKIVEEIKEVYNYIKSKKGYGMFSIQKSYVSMLAASLVADFYVEKAKDGLMDITLANSINAIVIAQQQAALVAVCAASAAASSSSS
ncbi:DUF4003 domain-containing protein [Clostridium oceanicum]|uniref:DUF4003 domain-containing protein n=1 Tax=Clostridium oceanicum TaxID=1543 RepID=A0ABP3UFP6_9CLOT